MLQVPPLPLSPTAGATIELANRTTPKKTRRQEEPDRLIGLEAVTTAHGSVARPTTIQRRGLTTLSARSQHMAFAMDAESLIRTLRAYDAPVDATAVRTAFDNEHNTVLRDWVSLHIAPDTLLSVDELNQ